MIERKGLRAEFRVDEQKRRISGYASTFGNVDSARDIVIKGCFLESIGRKKPKMLYEHDKLLGLWDVVMEDDKGLYVEGGIPKTTLGNDVYELAMAGALDSLSIGYIAQEFEWNDKNIRLLKKVDLMEVSLVTFPANEMAKITSVKSAPQTERDFENFLRDAGGYSREAAKIITAKGFKALSNQRDVDAAELNNVINNAINILRG